MKTIKHTIRDLLIWCICMLGITRRYQARLRKEGPLVRVLCFHDVPDRVWFESVITTLLTHYHIVTPEQFHAKDFHEEKINIMLTFDDGYQSWVDVALPVLKKYNLKGLFFITSGLLDAADEGEDAVSCFIHDCLMLSMARQPLTWEDARFLASAGHSIGGHTRTHPILAQLEREEVMDEIRTNKKRLEAELGCTLRDFAYPFGTSMHFGQLAHTIGESVGYHHLYSAITGFVSSKDIDVPRTLVEKEMNLRQLRCWVSGGYDIFSALKV